MHNASINSSSSGIPEIVYSKLPFNVHASSLAPGHKEEACFYELLYILFNDYVDNHNAGIPAEQQEAMSGEVKKRRLSDFLSRILVEASATQAPNMKELAHRKPANTALRYLACGDANKASEVLLQERSFNLAMLVAQLHEADAGFQEDARRQLDAWRDQDALSEIDLDIRALYELCAGNTTISAGKDATKGPEHKAATFTISEHLGLGWLSMFGLHFWFGTRKNDAIEDIIYDFAGKVAEGEESASFVRADANEDPLWVALHLFASIHRPESGPQFPAALSAFAIPGRWNSVAVLRALNAVTSSTPADTDVFVDQFRADQVATDISFEREARADIPGAVWALLHLESPEERAHAIIQLLLRNAHRLPSPPADDESPAEDGWTVLIKFLRVPAKWLFMALALHARALNESDRELELLIRAEEADEAHVCLVHRVAPVCVIDEDWDALFNSLALFTGGPTPEGWAAGGAVFEDFLRLVQRSVSKEKKPELLARLRSSLADMGFKLRLTGKPGEEPEGLEGVRRRVAVREMARVVVELGDEDQQAEAVGGSALLGMPLTGEVMSRLGRQVAVDYYANVMAAKG
jgi:nuclear pore complex protein Nup98-Nup96